MEKAEFLARVIIANSTVVEHFTRHDGHGGTYQEEMLLSPDECADRAEKLWEAFNKKWKEMSAVKAP